MISVKDIKQTIENLKIIQDMFIDDYIAKNNIDDDEVYIECEEADEIQNTIYILEEFLEE